MQLKEIFGERRSGEARTEYAKGNALVEHFLARVEFDTDCSDIEPILRHLGLWEEGVRVHTGADPPCQAVRVTPERAARRRKHPVRRVAPSSRSTQCEG